MINSFDNFSVIQFPEIQKNDFIPVQKKYLQVILLNISIIFTVFLITAIIVDFTNLWNLKNYIFWIYTVLLVFFGGLTITYILGFKTRMYLVRDKDISYKSGLFFKKLTTVPFNRIQHLEIDQGPFSKLFQLASLSVFTAGDSSDDLKIAGISLVDAEKIKEFISQKIDG